MGLDFVQQVINIGGATTEPTLRFYKKGFRLGGSVSPSWRDIILHGNTALTLVNAKADGLNYLKLFGDTEQLPETYLDTVTLSGGCEQPEKTVQVGKAYAYNTSTEVPIGEINQQVQLNYAGNVSDATIPNFDWTKTWELKAEKINFKDNTGGQTISIINLYNGTRSMYIGYRSTNGVIMYIYPYPGSSSQFEKVVNITLDVDYDFRIRYDLTNVYMEYKLSSANSWTTVITWAYSDTSTSPSWILINGSEKCYNNLENVSLVNNDTKLFGTDVWTQPTPSTPLDIVCNNGVLKARHQSGLPLGYTLLDYVNMSTGSYLLTDIVPTYDCKVEMDFQTTTLPASSVYFLGGRTIGYGGLFFARTISGGFIIDAFGTGSTYRYTSNIAATNNTRYKFTYDNQVVKVEKDDTTLFTNTFSETNANGDALCINGLNSDGTITPGQARIYLYSFKVWDNQGNLIADYVPAKNSSDVVGMYDLVSGQFFTNQSTGNFVAGSTVSDAIEIYTDGTVETVTDNVGNTANAEMLLAISTFGKDTQEVISGTITNNIGIKILDGTENWEAHNTWYWADILPSLSGDVSARLLCTHFVNQSPVNDLSVHRDTADSTYLQIAYNAMANATALKSWLATQYASGTPVIVLYCKTATTESVSGQFLSKSPVTQTAGSISNLLIAITESSHTTPTPQQPLPINCNNGILGIDSQGNITVTGTTETVEVTGKNLFDVSAITTGKAINARGSEVNSTVSIISDYIPVAEGIDLVASWIKNYTSSETVRLHAYNSNKTWLSQIVFESNSSSTTGYNSSMTGTTPTGCAYVRLSIPQDDTNVQIELGSTATTYEPYYNGGSATAEMLLKVGNYQDIQSVLDGAVTRNVGVKVLDGTENWGLATAWGTHAFSLPRFDGGSGIVPLICSHNKDYAGSSLVALNEQCTMRGSSFILSNNNYTNTSATDFKQWLADQYNAGTPVIVVYPLATATTESVTAQPLTIQAGTNIVEITQGSINNLPLEVSYKGSI